jgi:hypothetical protein
VTKPVDNETSEGSTLYGSSGKRPVSSSIQAVIPFTPLTRKGKDGICRRAGKVGDITECQDSQRGQMKAYCNATRRRPQLHCCSIQSLEATKNSKRYV